MRQPRKPLLVDYLGRPLAYSDFFQSGSVIQRREQPWRYYNATQDTDQMMSSASWRMMLSAARFLFANSEIIRGAILEKASYSFPLHARYTGTGDKTWGAKVGEPWLYEWKRNNNLRGGPYDQHTNSRLRMIGYTVDGDIGTALTMDENGWPKVQYIRAHRIGTREQGDTYANGPYKGRRARNGVILDDYSRTLGFQVLGDKPDEDDWISAKGMFLTYRPDYTDQTRGISHLVATIRPMSSIKRLHEYELRAHQIQSAYALLRKNQTGESDASSEALSTGPRSTGDQGSQASLTTETLEDGLILYVKNNMEELELISPNRPGGDSQAFWSTIIRGALYGMEWDPDFALALKEPGGAWARTILQKINRSILAAVTTEANAQRREDWYALNVAIAAGVIPGPTDGNTWSWEYQLGQPLITADSGNDLAAKREAYKLGTMTLDELEAEQGHWWLEHRDQRQTETVDLLLRARAIQTQFPELTLQECLTLLEQRTPNGSPTPAQPEDKTNDGNQPKPNDPAGD